MSTAISKPAIKFMGFYIYSMGLIDKSHGIYMGLMWGNSVVRNIANKYIGNYLKHFIFLFNKLIKNKKNMQFVTKLWSIVCMVSVRNPEKSPLLFL